MRQIILDERFLLLRPDHKGKGTLTGEYDDFREFFSALGNWCHNTDFTYRDEVLNDPQQVLAQFVASHWYDFNLPLDQWRDWDKADQEDFIKRATALGMDVAQMKLKVKKRD